MMFIYHFHCQIAKVSIKVNHKEMMCLFTVHCCQRTILLMCETLILLWICYGYFIIISHKATFNIMIFQLYWPQTKIKVQQRELNESLVEIKRLT